MPVIIPGRGTVDADDAASQPPFRSQAPPLLRWPHAREDKFSSPSETPSLQHQPSPSVKSNLPEGPDPNSQIPSPVRFRRISLSPSPNQPRQWLSAPLSPRPSSPTLPNEFRTKRPKRRKVHKPKIEVISLLSDDDEDPATTTVSAKRCAEEPEEPTTPKRKYARPLRPTPHNGPVPLPEHLTMEGRRKATAADQAKYMRDMKARVKSAIKQRSTMSSASEILSTATDESSSSPILFPLTSQSALEASHNDSSASDLDGSHQTLTPPPSSFLEADTVFPNQYMDSSQPAPTNVPSIAIPEEPPLCPEQANLVDLIVNGKNVFYTGSAGCGKSTVLKAITKRLRGLGKNVRIVAPTGRAALQVNGSTTWTFAGWTPDHHKRTLEELRSAAHGTFVSKRFRETEVLIIDEISMVENLHFERLNAVMKAARYKPHVTPQPAFGGVQVIVTGDFCQLPPVKPFQHCIECGFSLVEKDTPTGKVHVCRRHGEYRDEDKWAFRSKAWEECNFVHVHLNTIHRQNDETFIRILQKCRIGRQLSTADTELLMNHECMVHHATKLFATREEVGNVNRREFDRLKTLNHTYWCLDSFIWRQTLHPHLGWKGMRKPKGPQSEGPLRALDDHRFDECVQLKKGMLVVLLVNLDLAMGLCNGSQGIICGFEPYDPAKLPKAFTPGSSNQQEPENRIFGERAQMKEEQVKKFIEDPGARYKTWPVVRFHNGQVRAVYAECSIAELGDERPYSLLMRTQIPLAPAWAMTIHKSQSLTLDRVVVNLSRAFEEGQVYVALSRATGLRGLKIEGDARGLLAGLGGNPEVQQFLRDKFGGLDGVLSSHATPSSETDGGLSTI